VEISSIQKLWKWRFESFLRDLHFLAVLLDPRAHVRAFVQQQPSILGNDDMPVANRGNTPAINAAIDALHRWADQCVSDDQPYVKKQVECGHMMLLDAKQKLLEGQLRAYLGLHPKLSIKVLGIGEDSFRKCSAGDSPLQWFADKTPVACELRAAGLRVFSAKPSSASVELLWNVFGDNLTAKRRSMGNGRLAELVYCHMNMRLVPSKYLSEIDGEEFEQDLMASMFDVVATIDEQEEVEKAALALKTVGHVEGKICGEDVCMTPDSVSDDDVEIDW
jgi:hypothetical protein